MSGAPVGPRFFGHRHNGSALETIVGGTTVLSATSSAVTLTGTLTTSGALTVSAGGLTVTAGGLAVTGTVSLPDDAVVSAFVEEGLIQYVDIQLTNAQVKALATPIPIVASPGADKALIFHRIVIVSDASDTAWTEPSAPDDLVVEYAGGQDLTGAIEAGALIANSVNTVTYGPVATEVALEANVAIELFNTGGDWGGGNAANTMSIRVWYSVVPMVAFS